MKIEKINENQIRCTLTKEDLESHDIDLSELAHGSENTRALFQDMMQQANDDFGFEVNDKPLMVEAMPLSAGSIVLIITKVTNPEETEGNLSHISDELQDAFRSKIESFEKNHSDFESDIDDIHGIEDIHDLDKISGGFIGQRSENKDTRERLESGARSLCAVYVFDNLSDIIKAAQVAAPSYNGESTLYKSPSDNKFYLYMSILPENENSLNCARGVLSEYGKREESESDLRHKFFEEHYDVIVAEDAIEHLSRL